MNKIPCLYAVIRFAPFVETGEFANVGIVMMAPDRRYFGFKLMGRRHSRVTHFFEQLDSKVFKTTMATLRDELNRIANLLQQHGFDEQSNANEADFSRRLFAELVRPRETIIKFSESGGVLVDDPTAKLEDLYGHYVERDFVTREYKETLLDRGMRKWLWQARIADRFTKQEVGNDDYHATFPFVEKHGDCPVKVVKPLHLAQDQANKILDHGGTWLYRIQALKRRNLLPERVLFAVSGPEDGGPRGSAYAEIVGNLQDVGVSVLPFSEKEQIIDFVAARN